MDYSFKQLDELELAYAITIHKTQGSEYPAVVIQNISEHKRYTGLKERLKETESI